ncbi:GLUG motif-containing protein [Pseudoxanthomonas composti]|uniref:Filamentous hemagglutinin N-terminal domain-containing protein n=1 Tax=Pseudoxanthomonas composti TaxID=2137479 RepID=A0A4V1N1M4_9GAMM|nr:GLUG motif-containing protein [Pseudoxanthomonas composti]RXR08808.1 filamentous hemagglutinin N-terminal domain-containing protein [Pseudoxanthomonas composti]
MNRIFRTVWSHTLQAWVVTSELGQRCGKRGKGQALSVLLLTPLAAAAADLPTGGKVVSGHADLSSNGQQLTIDQTSGKLAMDWQSFDIGANQRVVFRQPDSQAIALNRVVGQDASRILGNLDANGRVFLVNPNGILFGQGASVNVGGLVASTLGISNEDFQQGRYRFKSEGTPQSVINQGSLQVRDGGAVALLGGQVSNQGVIVATGGSVALAAGQGMTLDFAGDGLLSVKVDEATADALAENRELIRANGGQVLLTARAGDALLKTVVNNTGVIEAQTLAERGGRIELLGGFDGGTVHVAGTLDASAPNAGNGGFIETSGAHVQVAEGTRITTLAAQGRSGTWLLDPTDFTVGAGSGAASASGIGASTLAANLQNGNVTLQTVSSGSESGNINVDAAVAWSANTVLTLNAHGDIFLNAPVTATGASAGLSLNYGGHVQNGSASAGSDYHVNAPATLGGAQASLSINGQAYTLIHSLADAATYLNSPGAYALAQDIDLSGVTRSSALVSSFQSKLAGLGHSINNLTISGASGYVGLFGTTSSNSLVRDVHLGNASISGGYYVGGLVGYGQGTIRNVTVDGTVTGSSGGVGGLAGYNLGLIDGSAFAGSVNGQSAVGGVVGNNVSGTIRNTHSTGSVTGSSSNTGGLVGYNDGGSLTNTYSTSNVSGTNYVGGLAGTNQNAGTIKNSYASGSVIGTSYGVGGLVGMNYQSAIANTYATGSVTAPTSVGGLVGINNPGSAAVTSASVSNSYATGAVSGTNNVGGLIGANTGSVSNASWDVGSTGQANAISNSGSGSVTNLTSFGSGNRYGHNTYGTLGTWSLLAGSSNVYVASDGLGNPAWIMIEGQTRPFLASEYSTRIGNAHQLQLMAYNLAANYSLSADIDASQTAGSNASGMWSSAGFSPVGDSTGAFTGSLKGADHTISGLTIARGGASYVGLFGNTGAGSQIGDLALTGATVVGTAYVGGVAGFNAGSLSDIRVNGTMSGTGNFVGGLTGYNDAGTIAGVQTSGTVIGSGGPYSGNYVGGLIGSNANGTISASSSSSTVSGGSSAGGLVGNDYQGTYTDAFATGNVSSTSTTTGNNIGGLIGNAIQSTLQNVHATGNVTATTSSAGGLVGMAGAGTIQNAYASGNVSGTRSVGGLVGRSSAAIDTAYATGAVNGTSSEIGGLIGTMDHGSVTSTHATGTVSGGRFVGGLVGYSNTGSVGASYATGNVAGTDYLGGLVGYNESGSIGNAYATGNVSGGMYVAGLAGYNDEGTIANTYASGDATGTAYVGGLVGVNYNNTVRNSYATGNVSGTGAVGGLVGSNSNGSIIASFFATDIGGNPRNVGLSAVGNSGGSIDATSGGRSWAALNTLSTFTDAGWAIDDQGGTGQTWRLYEQMGTPLLRSFLTQLSITTSISGQDKTYDGTGASGVIPSYTVGGPFDPGLLFGSSLRYATTGSNAGSYTTGAGNLRIGGLASSQQGYDIAYTVTGGITISPKVLTGAISAQGKTYDGTTSATTVGSLSGVIGNDAVSLSTSGTFADKNAGSGKTVNVSGSLGGSDAGNYVLGSTNATTTANITPKTITSNVTAQDKTYDGTTAAIVSGSLNGVLAGDAVVLGTSGRFSDRNAGVGKTVQVSGRLEGADAGNYQLQAETTATLADIAQAPLTVTALDASKATGQASVLDRYSVAGLLAGDTVAGVRLSSSGADAAAAPGDYAILASDAVGSGLGNYLIDYRPGVLSVQGQTTTLPTAALVARAAVLVPIREKPSLVVPAPPQAATAPLSTLPGLDIINRGIRLPEGI